MAAAMTRTKRTTRNSREGRNSELATIYAQVGALIMQPLTPQQRMSEKRPRGGSSAATANTFIAPNDRLTSFERIEIYNRQYWFRLIDCLYDDFPGLRAVLGEARFYHLVVSYLKKYPSRSFSLRNLGDRMEKFLLEEPRHLRSRRTAALDMVRFEWAQIEGFDGAALPPVSDAYIMRGDPVKLRFALQPYLTPLELSYPFDEFVIALRKKQRQSSEAGTKNRKKRSGTERPAKLPGKQKIYLVVHRFENSLYYKRLDRPAFALLSLLRDGAPLGKACQKILPLLPKGEQRLENAQLLVQRWFANWRALNWLCEPKKGYRRSGE